MYFQVRAHLLRYTQFDVDGTLPHQSYALSRDPYSYSPVKTLTTREWTVTP